MKNLMGIMGDPRARSTSTSAQDHRREHQGEAYLVILDAYRILVANGPPEAPRDVQMPKTVVAGTAR